MLIEIIVKLIIYFVVITLVRLVMKKLKNSESVITQQDVVIINEKVISKILLSVAIVYSILVIAISTLPLNISGKTLYIVAIFVIVLNVVLYLLGLHYYFYELELSSEGIYFRSGIIKKYRYSWKQVLSFEVTNNNKIIINCEKKKVKIELTEESYKVVNWLSKIDIAQNKHTEKEGFTIKATIFYIVLSFIFFAIFAGLLVMSIYMSSYYAVVVFVLLTLISIINMIKKIYDRIIINNEDITIQRLFKKNQYLKISDIKKAKRKTVDNAEVIYVYGINDKFLFKYSKTNENAYLFDSIMSKKFTTL